MSVRRTHFQLQSVPGFAACREPTEENAFRYKLEDDQSKVDCRPCIAYMAAHNAFVASARARQEHGTKKRAAARGAAR